MVIVNSRFIFFRSKTKKGKKNFEVVEWVKEREHKIESIYIGVFLCSAMYNVFECELEIDRANELKLDRENAIVWQNAQNWHLHRAHNSPMPLMCDRARVSSIRPLI